MDAIDLRNVFYIVATIALIFFSITVIAIFYLIIKIKRIADDASKKIDRMTTEISDQSRNMAKTFGRIGFARLFIKVLRLIF
ncbi:MAG: hypothetical protein KW804_01050 [Candidatus Doudnabacteria bacterium]|nr:hypothetical protein [Candidatus Doudnabacteria bacterium]